jgi:hypothetical protein
LAQAGVCYADEEDMRTGLAVRLCILATGAVLAGAGLRAAGLGAAGSVADPGTRRPRPRRPPAPLCPMTPMDSARP